jgi:lysophospholipase L1-like esterase
VPQHHERARPARARPGHVAPERVAPVHGVRHVVGGVHARRAAVGRRGARARERDRRSGVRRSRGRPVARRAGAAAEQERGDRAPARRGAASRAGRTTVIIRRRPHIVLLGDSIFDNAAYVRGGPDVVAQLAAALPAPWRATLLAVDGAVIADVARQLARVPADATHLVLSVGGNDALGHAGLLDRRAGSSAEVLGWFADAVDAFEGRYRQLLARVRQRALPTTLCTVYNGNLGPPTQRVATVALALFNDAILRLAAEHRMPTIELRHVCTAPADYANPIEPSVQGGGKIARAIAEAVAGGGAVHR